MKKQMLLILISFLSHLVLSQNIDEQKKATAYKIINLIKDKDYKKIKKSFRLK